MEKFILGRFFAFDELDIIDKKDIHCTVFLFQSIDLGVAFFSASCGFDELRCEHFGGYIEDLHLRVIFLNVVSDGMHQVSLAQSRR